MAHNHGNEYQVKIVCEDGTEELSGWVNNEEQVAQVMAAVHRPRVKAHLLRERNILCPSCLDREQRIVEYPLTDIPSPRYSPHDSRYLVAVGSMDQFATPACSPPPSCALTAKPANPTKKGWVKKAAKKAGPKEAAKRASA
jgi:hypothetical protein